MDTKKMIMENSDLFDFLSSISQDGTNSLILALKTAELRRCENTIEFIETMVEIKSLVEFEKIPAGFTSVKFSIDLGKADRFSWMTELDLISKSIKYIIRDLPVNIVPGIIDDYKMLTFELNIISL